MPRGPEGGIKRPWIGYPQRGVLQQMLDVVFEMRQYRCVLIY
jgi:hypothetical protein